MIDSTATSGELTASMVTPRSVLSVARSSLFRVLAALSAAALLSKETFATIETLALVTSSDTANGSGLVNFAASFVWKAEASKLATSPAAVKVTVTT